MKTNSFLNYGLGTVLACAALFVSTPVFAQPSEITKAEVEEFYNNLVLKEDNHLNFKRKEVTKEQLKTVIKDIMLDYHPQFIGKGSVIIVSNGQLQARQNIKIDYDHYESSLQTSFEYPQDVVTKYNIENIDLEGERANATIDYSQTLDITLGSGDMGKGYIALTTRSLCQDKLVRGKDMRLQLLLSNCKIKGRIDDINIDLPAHMQDLDLNKFLILTKAK